ncbi:unnamed protein product, partial [Durusdinium trenchii]
MIADVKGMEDEEYIAPHTVKKTWAKRVWGKTLAEAWPPNTKLLTEAEARSPRVCFFHAGTGSGKTHALLQAASAWQAYVQEHQSEASATVHELYVTYNMNQQLEVDRSEMTQQLAICIRLVLRLNSCSNAKCTPILQKLAGQSTVGLEENLRDLATHAISKTHGTDRVLLAVDECNLLSEAAVNTVDPALDFVAKLKATDYDGAITVLKGMIADVKGMEDEEYIAPHTVKKTWAKRVWGKTLAEAWPPNTKLLTEAEARSPRVCFFHAGTGSGKTHALLQAASAWQAYVQEHQSEASATVHELYVTYNMNQQLEVDRSEMTQQLAICIRLVLRLNSCSNAKCTPILQKLAGQSTVGLEENLRDLATHAISKTHGTDRVLLAVDECNLLSEAA